MRACIFLNQEEIRPFVDALESPEDAKFRLCNTSNRPKCCAGQQIESQTELRMDNIFPLTKHNVSYRSSNSYQNTSNVSKCFSSKAGQ